MNRQDEESDKKNSTYDKRKKDEYFESIFHLYYSPLCNYALKMVGDPDIAEDLVQNLFLQIYEKNTLNNISDPERYLIKSVKFKCIDYHRNNSKHQKIRFEEYTDKSVESVSDISEEEIEPLLHFFAAKLPAKTRKVFLLSRKSGMTYKEIAQELNISVKTVETQMGRALRQMRDMLKSQNFLSLMLFF